MTFLNLSVTLVPIRGRRTDPAGPLTHFEESMPSVPTDSSCLPLPCRVFQSASEPPTLSCLSLPHNTGDPLEPLILRSLRHSAMPLHKETWRWQQAESYGASNATSNDVQIQKTHLQTSDKLTTRPEAREEAVADNECTEHLSAVEVTDQECTHLKEA